MTSTRTEGAPPISGPSGQSPADAPYAGAPHAEGRPDAARPHPARPDAARHDPARPGPARPDTDRPDAARPILLAFSGGLDTSFCVPWLKETYGRPVITVTVDTGGIDAEAASALALRSAELGALEHHLIDARTAYFEQVLKFLIMGNVRRGGLYPLCVGAERVLQAQTIAQMALSLKTSMVAHGCTAAGNDQVRFEVALRTLAPELTIIAPVRDRAFKRPEQLQYLQEHGLPIPPYGAAYSVNRGLWGVTIGGQETLTSAGSIPESAWVLSKDAFSNPRAPERHRIGFSAGIPTRLDGETLSPVAIIERLEGLAGPFGIGRGIHLGDTVIGTKGRVAFEAPAAEVLLTAHRELEKLVLTGKQARIKESVAQPYGDLVHEGQHLDPVCRDIEALLVSSQARVTGEVSVLLRPGSAFIEGVASPHSLMAVSKGVYGEAAGEWTPADALGFSKMLALTGIFHQRAGAPRGSGSAAGTSGGAGGAGTTRSAGSASANVGTHANVNASPNASPNASVDASPLAAPIAAAERVKP